MKSLIRRFIDDTRAAAAFEFSASMLIFMPMFLVVIDLMLLVLYQADVQRATTMLGEQMRTKTPPLVYDPAVTGNTAITTTDPKLFFDTYCNYMIVKRNCQFLSVFTYARTTRNLDPNWAQTGGYGNYYYYGSYKNYNIAGSNITVPLDTSKNIISLGISTYLDLKNNPVNNFSLTAYIYQFFIMLDITDISAGKNYHPSVKYFTTFVILK